MDACEEIHKAYLGNWTKAKSNLAKKTVRFTSMPVQPTAVLLDVGGVFLLPSRDHIRSALSRIGHAVDDDEAIDRAHYVAVRVFPMDLDAHTFLGPLWTDYLVSYSRSLGVDDDLLPEAVDHLRNEYVTGALWSEVISGAAEGLAALEGTGIPIGIVSNADGTIESQLAELGICQVGQGAGVEVGCVVDSGVVGVEKPDPRIFDHALEAIGMPPDDMWYVGDTPGFDVVGARRAGLMPILMDPFGVNGHYGVETVRSLAEVAAMVEIAIGR